MLKRAIGAAILSLILFGIIVAPVSAAQVTYKPLHITGSHQIVNDESLSSVNNTFILEAENDAPMPEKANDGVQKITVAANSDFDFGEINFTKPGTYEYRVSREITNADNLYQDSAAYTVKVTVLSDGSQIVIYQKEGDDAKSEKIEYRDTCICAITFDLNGGTIDGDEGPIVIYVQKGETITLLEAPKKEGAVFSYWKGSRYSAGAKYEVTETHKFTAIYDDETLLNGSVKTGESRQLLIIAGLFAISCLVLVILAKIERRNRP